MKKCSPLQQAAYKSRKATEKRGNAEPEGQKAEHASFKNAQSGMHKDKINQRQANEACTRYRIPGDQLKHC